MSNLIRRRFFSIQTVRFSNVGKQKHENHMAYLIPYPIESFAKPILIKSKRTFIGRSPDESIQIQIAEKSISRRHACIHSADDHYVIEDLGSQNGTFLNSERIRKARLNSHDKITIGNRNFLFLLQSDPVVELSVEPSIETSETIAISLEEMDLSDIWAQNADDATRGFLNPVTDESVDKPTSDPLALQRLALLYQLSENLRTTTRIDDVYAKGIELIMAAIPAAEKTLVVKRSLSDEGFSVLAFKLRDSQQLNGDAIPVSQTVFDWVLTERVALVSQNIGADHRFQDSDSIRIQDLRSIICVPITGKNSVVGLLYAQSNTLLSPFTKDDAVFASAVANEMALNIDNIRLQKKLLRNERMAAIGLTVSNLAHNIKNLLAVHSGAAQLMDIHIKEKDYNQIVDKWRWIEQSFTGIGRLANDMLEYAKEDELYVKTADVNKLIQSNRQLFEDSFARDGLKLKYALTRQNPLWPLDEIQFQRALFNLVLNAADAVREKKRGRIQISTSVNKDRHLIVSVADNGCGISKEKKAKILELFYTTKGSLGTGLGLPMVQKFIEKSGGQLKFESKEGAGSVFKMIFPKNRG